MNKRFQFYIVTVSSLSIKLQTFILYRGRTFSKAHSNRFFEVFSAGCHRIYEINCLALDGFNLNSVHKLSSKEKLSWQSQGSNPGQSLQQQLQS